MPESRRQWLMTVVGALSLLAVRPIFSRAQSQGRPEIKPIPYPNGRDPNVPPGIDEPSHPDLKAIAQDNQKKLRSDVSKLYEMVSELKEEVEKTAANSTFSVSVLKKAEQIEKLAKQIKNLAKS